MIPRLKPYLDFQELLAPVKHNPFSVTQFEDKFAQIFSADNAVAFPYGRSALWAFFKALGIENAEVIQPAYTCSVVAHATVLSGNIPIFVDINLYDYNMNLEQVAGAITPLTRAIIATHLFGYPLDVKTLDEIVKQAEARYGNKIWVIQDCAHAFGARWQGELVCSYGDAALFGLGISKTITSIFGGMLTFQDASLAEKVRSWRDNHFIPAGWLKNLRRFLYLLASYIAFNESVYGFTYWLQEKTPLLNYFTKAYHLDEKIAFPPDYLTTLSGTEAKVGLTQLNKYETIIKKRKELAFLYHNHLKSHSSWIMPPIIEGATYSHYVIRVPDKRALMRAAAQANIQLGELIEYSIPYLKEYQSYKGYREYVNSKTCSKHLINLPLYADMEQETAQYIIKRINTFVAL